MKLKHIALILSVCAGAAVAEEVKFSADLFPHFQSQACTRCHDFHEKKRKGLAFNDHKGRTPETCAMCHGQEVTGFDHPEEWFARPGLYTSGMNAKETCEAVKKALHAEFKSEELLAKDLEAHLLKDSRVLWGIEGATEKSGTLPGGEKTEGLVKVGMDDWKKRVNAWIESGMKCD